MSQLAVASPLAEYPGVIIVASPNTASLAIDGTQIIAVDFSVPDMALRRCCRGNKLAERGVEMNRATLDGLAGRFRLIPEQIGHAVDEGCARARWRRAQSDSAALQGAVPDIPESKIFTPRRVRNPDWIYGQWRGNWSRSTHGTT